MVEDFIFDNRRYAGDNVAWEHIKVGDVVLEGTDNLEYRILTYVKGKYWEYFGNDGYFHSTSPEFCQYLVDGQKGCEGRLLKIN